MIKGNLMVDEVFEELKKAQMVKCGLRHEIVIKISDIELKVLSLKATHTNISKEELLRIYLLETPIFDGSVFDKKKRKKKMNDSGNTGGVA